MITFAGIIKGIHITACLLIVVAVLLQPGKGAGLALYGGGGETLFSAPSGSSFMRKLTIVLAMVFGTTSLMLTFVGTRSGLRSVTSEYQAPPAQPQQQTQESGAPLGAVPGSATPEKK